MAARFNNYGTVRSIAGSITLGGDSTHYGNFSAQTGAQIKFGSPYHTQELTPSWYEISTKFLTF